MDARVAFQNKAPVYDLLFRTATETLTTIAADPKHLGAHIGLTAVLHTWGSALTHHPHVHTIVPGGGLSFDGARWVSSRSNFLVHVNALARLFRGKMLAMLMDAHSAGQLKFFNTQAGLADKGAFKRFIAPLRRGAVCGTQTGAALSLPLHPSCRHLESPPHCSRRRRRRVPLEDYRADGPARWKTMRLHPHEFIRRFLLHVLPTGFHRTTGSWPAPTAPRASQRPAQCSAPTRLLSRRESRRISHRMRRVCCAAHARTAAPA